MVPYYAGAHSCAPAFFLGTVSGIPGKEDTQDDGKGPETRFPIMEVRNLCARAFFCFLPVRKKGRGDNPQQGKWNVNRDLTSVAVHVKWEEGTDL